MNTAETWLREKMASEGKSFAFTDAEELWIVGIMEEYASQFHSPPVSLGGLEEKHRMQLAGISTAAQGCFKDGDSIHPDYDTVALRDVTALYGKYDALYQKQSSLGERAVGFVEWVVANNYVKTGTSFTEVYWIPVTGKPLKTTAELYSLYLSTLSGEKEQGEEK